MTTPPDELAAAAARAFEEAFDGVIRLEPEDGAPLWIDGRRTPPQILAVDPAADGAGGCVWRANRETLMRALEGERVLAGAYLSGRLVVAGDMSVMARMRMRGAGHG